jgi:hypothetical protein
VTGLQYEHMEQRRLDRADVLIELASDALGTPVTPVHDLSWPHGESTVIEARDPGGTLWIVKQVRDPAVHTRETRALRDWAPRLGAGSAPRLVAAVEDRSLIVMDRLPGRAGVATTASEFRQAGHLIRRLHEAEPATPDPGYPARAAHDVDRWIRRMPGVVSAAELGFVRSRLALLESMPPMPSGPVHNDNQPRNWLTDAGGRVRVVDFGKAKRDVQLRDFERMRHQEWRGRPDLREAFFDGYGRTLTGDEEQALDCIGAVAALTTILWARSHGAGPFEQHGRQTLERLRGTP